MTAAAEKKATVIIPNYNGMAFLPECLKCLEAQEGVPFDIIAVDNGSHDGSVEWLREHGIRTIELESNKGFSAAVNAGIRASETEYVILLNNDAYVQPGFVKELVGCISRSRRAFAVSAMMVMNSKRQHIDSAGDGLTILGWAYQRGTDEPVKDYENPRPVFSACAGAAIYRRSVFDEIGYFDEQHFAYLEDIDVSWRAKIAGYINYYCPAARCFHVGSGTSGSKYNPFKVRLSARNNIYLQYKNQPLPQLLINLIPILTGMIIKAVFFRKLGFIKDYNDGIREGLRGLKQCRKAPRAGRGFFTYLAIEGEMLAGTLEYIISFAVRQARKVRH